MISFREKACPPCSFQAFILRPTTSAKTSIPTKVAAAADAATGAGHAAETRTTSAASRTTTRTTGGSREGHPGGDRPHLRRATITTMDLHRLSSSDTVKGLGTSILDIQVEEVGHYFQKFCLKGAELRQLPKTRKVLKHYKAWFV